MAEQQGTSTPAGGVTRAPRTGRADLGLLPAAPPIRKPDRRRKTPIIREVDDDDDDDIEDADDPEVIPVVRADEPMQNTPPTPLNPIVAINWVEDLERKTLLEQRKLVNLLATKERQVEETLEHLNNNSCPKSIKATVALPVPEFLKTQVDTQLKKIIRDYELAVLQVQGQIREAEGERIKQSLQQLFPRHLTEVQKRHTELVNARVLHPDLLYDESGFQKRLDADAQKTRFLVLKTSWAKQEKRDKLAEKKAAERLEESLLDPEIVKLRKDMAQLKTKVAATGKGSKNLAPPKPKEKPKSKSSAGSSKNHGNDKGNSVKAKNSSGPGKQGGRRGPQRKEPTKKKQGKAGGPGAPRH